MTIRRPFSTARRFRRTRSHLIPLAVALVPTLALATDVTKTWDAVKNDGSAPPNANFFQNTDWDLDISPTWTGNTDSILFAGGGSGTTITLNITGGLTQYLVKSFTFNDGVYTFGGGQNLTIGDATTSPNNTGNLTNNTPNVQTFSLAAGTIITFRGGTINAAVGGFTFGANPILNFGGNSNDAGHDVVVDGPGKVTVNSVFTGTGTDTSAGGSLIKNGSGTLLLQSDSTAWDGRIVINSGVVEINKGGALGSTAGRTTISGGDSTGRLNVKGGINVAEPLYLEGRTSAATTPHLVNLSGNNTVSSPIQLTSGGSEYAIESTAGTLTVSGNVVYSTASGATNLRLGGGGNGVITGNVGAGGAAISIVKDGIGTWSLPSANAYTGSTLVSAGRLNLTTAHAGGGAITVGDGATLGVTVAAAGQSLVTTALSIGSDLGATLALDTGSFGNPTAPLIDAGALSVSPSSTLSIKASGSPLAVGEFTLVHYGGSIGGAGFAGLTLGALPARVSANLVDDAAHGRVALNVTAFDFPKWTGALSNTWDFDDGSSSGTINWKEAKSGLETRYLQGVDGIDRVLFDDSAGAAASNVSLSGVLTPSTVTVDNSALTYTFTGSGNLSGGGNLVKQGTGTLILANSGVNDYTGTTTILAGTLQIGDGATSGAGSIGSGNVINNGTLLLNRPDALTIGPVIGGSGTIVKSGTGAATLSANNNYTGAVMISSGTLKLGNSNALGSTTAGTTIQSGATLDVNGRTAPVGEIITVSGTGVLDTGAIVNTGTGGSAIGVKNVVFAADTTFGGTTRWDIRDSPGGLNAAGFALSKVGTNTISLANLGETHLGDVNITAGRLTVEGDTTLGDGAGSVRIAAGAELALEENSAVHTKPITLDSGQIIVTGGTGNRIASPLTLNGNATIRTNANTTLNVSGVIGGTGNLTKGTGGILILSGDNTYQGATTVTLGTTRFGNDGPNGAPGVGDIVFNAAAGDTATLAFRRNDTALVVSNNIVSLSAGTNVLNIGSNSAITPATTIVTFTGTNSFPGAVNLNGGSLRITNGTALGAGPKTVTIANAFKPSLRLNGATGDIALASDISLVTSNDDAAFPAIRNEAGNNSIAGSISLSNGGGGNTRVIVDAGTLALSGNIAPASTATSARTLILDGAGNGTVSGILSSATQSLGLTKAGAGAWTLTAANTYTGNTAIQAGTLKLGGSGSIASTPRLDLSAGATLDLSALPAFGLATNQILAGSGTVLGSVTDAPGAQLLPGGAGVGTLGFANDLALTGGGSAQFHLGGSNTAGGTANDLITVGRNLSLAGNTALEIVPTGAPLSGTYQVISYGGILTGGAPNLTVNHNTRYSFSIDTATSGAVKLAVSGSAKSVTWAGDGAANLWDVNGATNFNGGAEKFFHTDSVIFDGSSANHAVTISGTVIPNAVTISGDQDLAFLGTGSISGAPGGLTKSGTGVLTIGTANTITGHTDVNGGTLIVSGSISGSAVAVAAGATLGGAGTITTGNQSLTLASGAFLSPGLGAGTLTLALGTATLDLGAAASAPASGAFVFELGGGAVRDRVLLSSGSLSLGTGVLAFDDFSFTPLSGFGAGTYTLFQTSSIITGAFDANAAHLSGLVGGLPATIGVASNGNDLVLTVVPEPRSSALLIATAGLLIGFRPRRPSLSGV